VAVGEALAILLALLTLALLPCLVVVVLFADAFLNTVRVQRLRIHRATHQAAVAVGPTASHEVRPVDSHGVRPTASREVPPEAGLDHVDPTGPPLEQIAAEIHRLTYARRTATAGTPRFIAATRAYDRRLSHACRALEIDEHLAELTGVDLELERLRVEGELLGAGFVLDTDYSRPA
jgi:hypothetical protein